MSDFSPFYHAIAAVALQCAVGLIFGDWLYLALCCIGSEMTLEFRDMLTKKE